MHVQDDWNPLILRMLEDRLSLGAAHISMYMYSMALFTYCFLHSEMLLSMIMPLSCFCLCSRFSETIITFTEIHKWTYFT